jgi:hypothetical protein
VLALGVRGPRRWQPGEDGGPEVRTAAGRMGWWLGEDGDREARWPGDDGGLQAGVRAGDGSDGALQAATA